MLIVLKMTAVSPVLLETVLDVEDQKTPEPVSLFINNNGNKLEGITIDEEIVPKRTTTLGEGLHVLLASMKLFGLYFSRRSEDVSDDLNKKSRKWNVRVIYAFTVVALLWINALRMLSMFTYDDKFGLILLNKLIAVIWAIQCAISQTAIYAACFSGRLDVVFRQSLDDSCATHARKFSIAHSVVAWSIIMSTSAFFMYGLFFASVPMDMLITPFQVHIIISYPLIPRIITYFISLYLLSAFIFTQIVTFVLAMIFSHQFKKVTKSLESCLDNQQRQVSDTDIEEFRQKHQEISMNVSYVDDSLMFSNASAFCCQLICLIILLYMLIFYHSFMGDAVMIASYVMWVFIVAIGLTLTAAGGIVVHYYVSIFTVSSYYCSFVTCETIAVLN